jgi:hypothetical protein
VSNRPGLVRCGHYRSAAALGSGDPRSPPSPATPPATPALPVLTCTGAPSREAECAVFYPPSPAGGCTATTATAQQAGTVIGYLPALRELDPHLWSPHGYAYEGGEPQAHRSSSYVRTMNDGIRS